MEMIKNALNNEIKMIMDSGVKSPHFQLLTYIRCNNKDIKTEKTISLDINREYSGSFADVVMVECAMGWGDYVFDVYPYKANLEVTIYLIPSGEVSYTPSIKQSVKSFKYRGLLIESSSEMAVAHDIVDKDRFSLNIAGLKRFKMQLIDLTTEWVRLEQVGGVFKNRTVSELAQFLLTQQSKRVKLTADQAIKGVDIVPADNKEVRATIAIPPKLLVDVPEFLQNHAGGFYSAGIGYYLQSSIWYLFPLFNLKRFDKTPNNLTIINVPKGRMPGIEQTYRMAGKQLIILSTGQSKHSDKSEGTLAAEGNGVRYIEARSVLEGNVTVADNKMTYDRSKANSEFLSDQSATGLNNASLAKDLIVGNGFKETAKIAARQGTLFSAEWENSNPELLTPGMPVKVIYPDGNKVKEMYGVLHAVHSYYHLIGEGMLAQRHGCTSVLGVFVERTVK